MTTTPTPARARRLELAAVERVVALLESDFGTRDRDDAVLVNQVLLDALDRGERDRFVVWPGAEPEALVYVSEAGTLVPAGDPAGAPALAEVAERMGWRVMVGDRPLAEALLDCHPRGLFRRRPSGRGQRFMATRSATDLPVPDGFRRARAADVADLTELACRLHVEDLMGPPISRASRPAVQARMADSVARGLTFVVERDRRVVAKLDISLRSPRRGGQIAGVYVEAGSRGRGIAAGAVAALARDLLAEGLPGVTLHVRSDNAPAQAAYRRAGLVDAGAWILAMR